jgi:chitinase
MKRFDRMSDPVSHTAAVTAAVSFLLLVCVVWLGLGVPRAARSLAWWGAGLAAALVLVSSVAAYFKPHGVWSVVPLGLSGAVLLGLAIVTTWDVIARRDVGRAWYPFVMLAAWAGWVGTRYVAWRKARSGATTVAPELRRDTGEPPSPALLAALTITLSAAFGVAAQPAPSALTSPSRVVGYFAAWAPAHGYQVGDIPAGKLTHVNYAFAVIKDGRCSTRGPGAPEDFAQLRALKQEHPRLRMLISVGGWADSGAFSDAALTDASRQTFARSCAEFVRQHGFDGVDIDWEYPGGGGADKTRGRPQDTKNFTLLLADLRRALDAQGKSDGNRHYLLTIAAPASPRQYQRMELGEIHKSLDWINLMTYDMAGEWSHLTDFHAPLYAADEKGEGPSADATVRGYLAAGVPPEKLLLGVPFYGRAWAGVKDVDHGLHQPHASKPPRPSGNGGFAYRNLAANYLDKSAKHYWNDRAKAPWLFDEKSGVMITYDDPQSVRLKSAYARDHHLGGIMIWELSEDDDRSTLLNAVVAPGKN